MNARIQSLEMAFRMQTEAQEAFDLSRETAKTREDVREEYLRRVRAWPPARHGGARRPHGAGLLRGDGQPWDDHGDIKDHAAKARQVDRPIAALLKDLKQRGMLDDTLVLWGGEFGRTPTSEGAKGRDHNNLGFTVWLAGGGVKGGITHGATDEFGFAAVQDRTHVHDLHATILHLMGLDHEKLTYRYSGRDFRLTDVEGKVMKAILA